MSDHTENAVPAPDQTEVIDALPCEMYREEPFDFAYCVVHDTTFALGDVCERQKINTAAEKTSAL